MLAGVLRFARFGAGGLFGDLGSLVGMSRRGNDRRFGFGTFSAHAVLLAIRQAIRRGIHNPISPCVTDGIHVVVAVGIAAHAGIEVVALLNAGRRNRSLFVRMSEGIHKVRTVPLAADGTFVLIVALLGASRCYPNRVSVGVTVAKMLPCGIDGNVARHGHAIGIANPAEELIALLYGILEQSDLRSVRKNELIKRCDVVLVVEGHGVDIGDTLNNRICNNIRSRGCGNGIGNTVAVQIPTVKHIGILLVAVGGNVGLANDLRI